MVGDTLGLIGSPPLARRARVLIRLIYQVARFTSARAESTPALRETRTFGTVHLRSRGEHNPPALRGGLGLRFTSARAESTTCSCRPCWRTAVHLRSRGEHATRFTHAHTASGSPPLARRAQQPASCQAPEGRFTSARAESTSSTSSAPTHRTVHLRSRGEHAAMHYGVPYRAGSPPLARRALGLDVRAN